MNTKTSTSVFSKVSLGVRQKVAIGFFLVGAVSAAAGFVIGSQQKNIQVTTSQPTSTVIAPPPDAPGVPLLPQYFIEPSTANLAVTGVDLQIRLKFWRGATWLGTYYFWEGNFSISDPQSITGTDPLFVEVINLSTVRPMRFPGATFYAATDLVPNLTICIPAVDVAEDSIRHFVFDTRGNAYTDLNLTTRAMSLDCTDLLATSFRPNRVTSASWSIDSAGKLYPGRNGFTMGVYCRRYTPPFSEWRSREPLPESREPMSLEIEGRDCDDPLPVSIPGSTLSLETDIGSKVLAVPATVVTSTGNPVIYYYNQRGEAYSDSLLQRRVFSRSAEPVSNPRPGLGE